MKTIKFEKGQKRWHKNTYRCRQIEIINEEEIGRVDKYSTSPLFCKISSFRSAVDCPVVTGVYKDDLEIYKNR